MLPGPRPDTPEETRIPIPGSQGPAVAVCFGHSFDVTSTSAGPSTMARCGGFQRRQGRKPRSCAGPTPRTTGPSRRVNLFHHVGVGTTSPQRSVHDPVPRPRLGRGDGTLPQGRIRMAVIPRGVARRAVDPLLGGPDPRVRAEAGRELPLSAVGYVLDGVPTQPLALVGIAPCRLADTRVSQGYPDPFRPPALVAFTPRVFPVAGYCGIPNTAQAVVITVNGPGRRAEQGAQRPAELSASKLGESPSCWSPSGRPKYADRCWLPRGRVTSSGSDLFGAGART
jgi:hypothetical protein